MKKKLILLLAAALLLSGCSKEVDNNLSTENSSTEVEELRIMDAGSVIELCSYDEIPVEIGVYEVTDDDIAITIKSILDSNGLDIAVDELTDEIVVDYFTEYSISTVDELVTFVTNYLTEYADSRKNDAISSAVEEYLLTNSKVNINDEYVKERVILYQDLFTHLYVDADDTLENHLSGVYGMTVEEAVTLWEEVMTQQVSLELILKEIAIQENITVSESEYTEYINYVLLEYPDYTELQLYELYGYGEEQGYLFFMEQCVANKAHDFVVQNALVSETEVVESVESTTESE